MLNIAIAGAGIGGLTAALSLHATGLTQIKVLESAREIRDLGVGVNLPPHAVRELTELGLGAALEQAGIQTAELAYYDTNGQLIWAEKRGLEAGYRWPQYSIHRGKLQQLLVKAVHERLGLHAIRTGLRVMSATNEIDNTVHLTLENLNSQKMELLQADVLIAADGIRSRIRDHFFGKTIPLASNGWVMYRGTTAAAPFLTGRSMVIVGDEKQRVVLYPIADGVINWLLVRPKSSDAKDDELGNWNTEVPAQKIAEYINGWSFNWLDIHALVQRASVAYAYPMADIDPLPNWVFKRCALLGDAAHAMYPFGSNGASQAILDARILAFHMATNPNLESALLAYENQRRNATAKIQLANRTQAGEIMAKVSSLARQNAHDKAANELQEVERHYKLLAGFDVQTLNSRESWNAAAKTY